MSPGISFPTSLTEAQGQRTADFSGTIVSGAPFYSSRGQTRVHSVITLSSPIPLFLYFRV